MEYWDLLDSERRPLGRTHPRGVPMGPGEYHAVVQVWTINPRGELLFTLRSPEKDEYPNEWECTGGSVLAGETSRSGAVRELWEETGIRVEPSELRYLATDRADGVFYDSYLVVKDLPLSALTLQPGETVRARIADGTLCAPLADRLMALADLIRDAWDADPQ